VTLMAALRQLWAAVRLLLVMTVLLGLGYPAVITLAAQAFPTQANGSLLTTSDGRVVGSALIGQQFEGPQWFQSRPSTSDYAGTTSGGSNLSPVSAAAAEAIAERRAALAAANPNAVGPVPADALTASASGLDPHISPAYARWQLPRVAAARQLSAAALEELIGAATEPAPLGFLGQDGVNVVRLNLMLSTR
jgi:potassium-transporting ATPase KdpC subunit